MIAEIMTVAALVAGGPSERAGEDPVRELGDRQLAGQRIITGFPGKSPPAELVRMIRDGRVAGVVLFAYNFDSPQEAEALISDLRDIRRPRGLREPLLVAVDQEGGLVKRLPGPPTMSAERMGAEGEDTAARQGQKTGRYLKNLGFNLDFAPVLDLGIPGGEIEETDRAFDSGPQGVIKTGVAFARALERQGVAATAKHFPGFGRAGQNTDDVSQTIGASRTTLRNEDEKPFAAFAEDGGDVVMLSNAIYPALDGSRPAGLSRAIASKELRRVASFEGVSVTDSLDAAAIRAIGSPKKIAGMVARAGTDVLLYGSLSSASRAAESMAVDLRKGRLDRDRFRNSVERVLALRDSLRG